MNEQMNISKSSPYGIHFACAQILTYISMYLLLYLHMYVWMYICRCIYTLISLYICRYVCTHLCSYVPTNVRAFMSSDCATIANKFFVDFDFFMWNICLLKSIDHMSTVIIDNKYSFLCTQHSDVCFVFSITLQAIRNCFCVGRMYPVVKVVAY